MRDPKQSFPSSKKGNRARLTISELFDKAMNDAAKTREEELERERPAKLDHIPLTLKPTNLEDKTNEMMLRMLWKKRQVQQGIEHGTMEGREVTKLTADITHDDEVVHVHTVGILLTAE